MSSSKSSSEVPPEGGPTDITLLVLVSGLAQTLLDQPWLPLVQQATPGLDIRALLFVDNAEIARQEGALLEAKGIRWAARFGDAKTGKKSEKGPTCADALVSVLQNLQADTLIIWGSPEVAPIEPGVPRYWHKQLQETGCGLLYSDGLIIEGPPEKRGHPANQRFLSIFEPAKKPVPTARPGCGPEWLLEQNLIGPCLAVDSDLFVGINPSVFAPEETAEGLIHRLALVLVEKAPKIARSSWPAYTLSPQTESNFAYPPVGTPERVLQFLRPTQPFARIEGGLLPGRHRVRFELLGRPLVSLLIPFRDKPALLEQCIESVLKHDRVYPNWEIVGINNQSSQPQTLALMARYSQQDKRIRFIDYDEPFNYAAISNYAVSQAKGDQVVFLNNDIEILTPDWLIALLEYSQQDEVGMVGAQLTYPDGTLQHGGCVMGLFGTVGHVFKHTPPQQCDARGWLHQVRNVSAVTGALMMVKKPLYEAAGGMDEARFAVSYNDIDLCLKLHEAGYRNVYTPYCLAIHHEGKTRKSLNAKGKSPQQQQQAKAETEAFKTQYQAFIEAGDPYYSRHLTRVDESGGLAPKSLLGPALEGAFDRLAYFKLPGGKALRLYKKGWNIYSYYL